MEGAPATAEATPGEFRPKVTDVGIIGISVYIPRRAVAMEDLERFDGAPRGKYTIGLGQRHMSYVTDREDVTSLCLTVLQKLTEQYDVSYADIGRLELGTESRIDRSKSLKSEMMQLFESSGNFDVEGLDNTNACYGGTAALFNTISWIESSAWDGRYGVVVAGDIAVYAEGPARPTGGAGAVAMLIGKGEHACLRLEIGHRASRMEHTYDFFKPNPDTEYPVVKGMQTIQCFVRALDGCYSLYTQRAELIRKRFLGNTEPTDKEVSINTRDSIDYALFHAPYNKMVRKAFARLAYLDFMRTSPHSDEYYSILEKYRTLPPNTSYLDREATQAFLDFSKDSYEKKCAPAAWLGKEIGNAYTASLYLTLAALISEVGDSLAGARILLFSFGSGFASSVFSLRVVSSVQRIRKSLSIRQWLNNRIITSPEEYNKMLITKERRFGKFGYTPVGSVDELYPGSFYLQKVGERGERFYERYPDP